MTDSYLTTENKRMLKARRPMHSSVSCVQMPEYAVTPMLRLRARAL